MTSCTLNRIVLAVCCLLLFLIVPVLVQAQDQGRPPALRDVGFDQRLGAQVPLELEFHDETGKKVRLGDYFGKRPVILNFVYYNCQDFCPLLLEGMIRTFRALAFDIGDQFAVLTVSFDAHDTPALAAAKKSETIERYSRPVLSDGWRFLTGDHATVLRLTEVVGFRYNYDDKTARYGHAAGIVILTPEGRIARYFYGVEFSPRDVRLGLIEASANRIGSPIDQLLLFCYHYDPVTGKYGFLIANIIRLSGIATALALGIFIIAMLRGERQKLDTSS